MSNFSFEPLKLKLATNNIIIPMENGVADLTNAETSAKIMLAGKELFPIFDERIGGRNLILNTSDNLSPKKIGLYYNVLVNYNESKNYPKLESETFYTVKIYVDATTSTEDIHIYFNLRNSEDVNASVPSSKSIIAGEAGYITMTFETPPDMSYYTLRLTGSSSGINTGSVPSVKELKLEKGNKATDWSPAPEEVLQLSTLTSYNCSAAIVGDLVKITSHKPGTTRGWVDVTVNYGNLSNTKRLNWSVEGVEPYKPLGTLLTMNNRGIKL